MGNMQKNLVKIGRAVPKIWSRTDKHTHRHRHDRHNTPLRRCFPSGGGVTTLQCTSFFFTRTNHQQSARVVEATSVGERSLYSHHLHSATGRSDSRSSPSIVVRARDCFWQASCIWWAEYYSSIACNDRATGSATRGPESWERWGLNSEDARLVFFKMPITRCVAKPSVIPPSCTASRPRTECHRYSVLQINRTKLVAMATSLEKSKN